MEDYDPEEIIDEYIDDDGSDDYPWHDDAPTTPW